MEGNVYRGIIRGGVLVECGILGDPLDLPAEPEPGEVFQIREEADGLHLPAGIRELGSRVFEGNRDLGAVFLPEGVEVIQSNAFTDSSLQAIHLPRSLRSIGEAAFLNCRFLTSVQLPENLETMGTGVFFLAGLKEISLPAKMRTVPSNAFVACPLERVVLPEHLEHIGDMAFAANRSLVEIHIPDSVVSLGYMALWECSQLREVKLPAGLKRIGWACFQLNGALERIRIPDGVKVLEKELFSCCRKLREVSIPDGLERIGPRVFECCDALTSLTIPASVRAVAQGALGKALKTLTVRGRGILSWTDAVVRLAPQMDLQTPDLCPSELPDDLMIASLRGFGSLYRQGYPFPGKVREDSIARLSRHKRLIWDAPQVRTVLLEEKLLSLREAQELLERVLELKQREDTAPILMYIHQNFTEEELEEARMEPFRQNSLD